MTTLVSDARDFSESAGRSANREAAFAPERTTFALVLDSRFVPLFLVAVASSGVSCGSRSTRVVAESPKKAPVSVLDVDCPVRCSGSRELRICEGAIPENVWDAGNLSRALDYYDPEEDEFEYEQETSREPECGNGRSLGYEPIPDPPERARPRPREMIWVKGRRELGFALPPPSKRCDDDGGIIDLEHRLNGSAHELVTQCREPSVGAHGGRLYGTEASPERFGSIALSFVTQVEMLDGSKRPIVCHRGVVEERVSARSSDESFSVGRADPHAAPPAFGEVRRYGQDSCCSFETGGDPLLLWGRLNEERFEVYDVCRLPSRSSPGTAESPSIQPRDGTLREE